MTQAGEGKDRKTEVLATEPREAELLNGADGHVSVNQPKGDLFYVTQRGQKMHVRVWLPEGGAENIKGVLFFFHGYGGHGNSPGKIKLGQYLSKEGICAVFPDLLGHGYSEGKRAFTESWQHWIDDHRQLLDLIAGGASDFGSEHTPNGEDSRAATGAAGAGSGAGTASGESDTTAADASAARANLGLTREQAARLAQVPLFLTGESLGGGQCIALGLRLQEELDVAQKQQQQRSSAAGSSSSSSSKDTSQAAVAQPGSSIAERFAGCVLIAPAIRGNPPPKPVQALLRYLVVPLIPEKCIPNALESVSLPEKVWLRQEDIDACANDGWNKTPTSLGWGKNMRFGMAVNMLDLTLYNAASVNKVRFPFCAMHDPEDAIVQFAGTALLRDTAVTPADAGPAPSRSREVHELKGLLHDLLTNDFEIVSSTMLSWVQDRLARISAAHSSSSSSGGGGQ